MIFAPRIAALAMLLPFGAGILLAAEDRIVAPIDATRTVVLKGHVHPNARPQYDEGPVEPSLELSYVTLLLKPAASLAAFLDEQQNPSSPEYHRWLTPEQFADRFGLSGNDIEKIVSWLQSRGLRVNDVARGRHWITFSGTAEQTARAFRTGIHRYRIDGKTHFANATEPSVPAALANVVSGFDGLNDFGLSPMNLGAKDAPDFNSGSSHYLAPDDVATIYGIAPLYSAGFDGTGQKLVVIGRTDIDLEDIRSFRKRFNLPPSDPQLVLVGPDPGTSATDLTEADLDIEWAGAVARNATIVYVYSNSVNTSAQYAIDHNLAPVITMSYGTCEPQTTPALRSIAQQANAQGITWVISSGDSGAATCDRNAPTPQAAKGRTVSFPASLPEVTAIGGTEFNEGSGNYWAATNSANGASALSYIPEKAWNTSATRNQLSSGGGGASVFFPKPIWQTGPGVPDDKARDLPDIALAASPDHDGYEVTTGGSSRVFGGTSVGTPVFAGVIALLNQYLISKGSPGQPGVGNVNPMLYRLARATTDVFHDITDGNNMVPCAQSSPNCENGLVGYSAGPGYDLATGLGSIDAYHLVTEWNKGAASTTVLTASPGSVGLSDTVMLTATVTGGGGTPTGTVNFLANDMSLGTAALTPSGGTATATLIAGATVLPVGNATITALYSGDTVFNSSAGSATVTVSLPASGSAVVPSLTPNPVYQIGSAWPYTIRLSEKAGVATTLTGFTVDGLNQPLTSFPSTNIPANGTLSTSLAGSGLTAPINRVFRFTGMDANGVTWSQQITVPFLASLGPALAPSMTLASTPATVLQNPAADSTCQWSHQLTVQEQGGFLVQLTRFSAGSTDLTGNIQQLFGTTRLAPFGMLQARICWSDLTAPTTKNYQLIGTSETGGSVGATLTANFSAPAPSPAAFSVSPQAVTIPVADSSQSGTATLALSFAGGAPQWTASLLPANRTASWLKISPASGTGPAQLTIQASGAGLSKGVYQAIVAIQSANAIPQSVNVPVTFVVGASSTVAIKTVANAASFTPGFSPGMFMSVFGSQLAPSVQQATRVPLPLTMVGVSVTVNGVTAPLHYVSPEQINIQIPYETGSGTAILGVNNNGQVASYPFPISLSAPGIFPAGSLVPSATGQQGQILTAFITGQGDVTPSLATGAAPAAGTAVNRLPQPRLPVAVTVGSVNAHVEFAGIPTGLAGVTQINFTVPPDAPLGVQPVIVTVGGAASAAVNLNVTSAQ